jgi:hypothetical protein
LKHRTLDTLRQQKFLRYQISLAHDSRNQMEYASAHERGDWYSLALSA